jgi:steroid 5-alpha reductase family enzyme
LDWLLDARFIVGVLLFITGYAINRWADSKLRRLRGPGETDYKIPYGGLYKWISCPNYLGEIIEWFGWAIATWSIPGLAFAIWTLANLAPRARSHHIWYKTHFAAYPQERKALVPWLW